MSSLKRKCPILLFFNLLVQTLVSASDGFPSQSILHSMQLQPEFMHDLVEEESRDVKVKVSLSHEQMRAAQSENGGGEVEWKLVARSLHPEVASVDLLTSFGENSENEVGGKGESSALVFNSSSMRIEDEGRFYSMNSTVTVKGRFLGKTGVQIRLVRADDWLNGDENEWGMEEEKWMEPLENHKTLEVWVKRGGDSERLTKIFVGTLMILIPLANIIMGCELDMGIVFSTLRRPTAPMIGLCTQFIVMPLLAYAIANSVFVPHGEYSLALGLFITGCAPGGGASNFWTILLGGNVNLSVTMTFLSTLASFVMMPLWIYLLGKDFLVGFGANSVIKVPYAKIGSSLASLVIPLLIGVAIAKWRPNLAAKARKVMRPFIVFVLLFVVIFGAISNLYMFRMITARSLIAGLLLPWCGFMFGCFASIITRRTPADVTAIAIETGIQNTGIAILLLKFSFPAPDSDISSLLPVIVACFTPGPLMVGAAIHKTVKWFTNKKTEIDDPEKPPPPLPLVERPSKGRDTVSPTLSGKTLDIPREDSPGTGLINDEQMA